MKQAVKMCLLSSHTGSTCHKPKQRYVKRTASHLAHWSCVVYLLQVQSPRSKNQRASSISKPIALRKRYLKDVHSMTLSIEMALTTILLTAVAAALCSGSPIPRSSPVPDSDDGNQSSTTGVRRWMRPCEGGHEQHQKVLDEIETREELLYTTIKSTIDSASDAVERADKIRDDLVSYFIVISCI